MQHTKHSREVAKIASYQKFVPLSCFPPFSVERLFLEALLLILSSPGNRNEDTRSFTTTHADFTHSGRRIGPRGTAGSLTCETAANPILWDVTWHWLTCVSSFDSSIDWKRKEKKRKKKRKYAMFVYYYTGKFDVQKQTDRIVRVHQMSRHCLTPNVQKPRTCILKSGRTLAYLRVFIRWAVEVLQTRAAKGVRSLIYAQKTIAEYVPYKCRSWIS